MVIGCSLYYGKTGRDAVKDTQILLIMQKLWLRNVKVLSLKLAHLGIEAKQSDSRPSVTNVVSVLDIWI